jgi:8-oxo-dGTP pyrophosphatase MutT (NUDIX family)
MSPRARPRLRLCYPGDHALAPSSDLATALGHIEAALPGDPTHEAHRARMRDFLATHPDALDRTCADGHLTGSAMVVDPATGRFLLMLHAKLGRWFQPGGHADGNATLPGVAWREATEETGVVGLTLAVPAIDLDIHEVAPPHGPHLHLDVRYLAVAPAGATPARNHESLDLRWATVDELAGYGVDPGTHRLAAAALAALDELRL